LSSNRDPQSFVDQEIERFRAELFDFLRIPSISADSSHNGDTREAATWLAQQMERVGLRSEVVETPGHPIVLGEWRGAGPDAPTLLIYGHYDVQPSDPDHLWTTPAFEPTVRDGRIYARGSADDKGQLYLHVKAVEAHLATRGTLPANVVILAEGEEEVGSPNLVPFVKANRDRLKADAVVISDSAMFAPGLPSLLFSLRGLAYFELTVRGPASDLHSGMYGGAVVNPANALAQVLASLHDADGRIAIEGFYDDVVDWDAETLDGIRALPFDEENYRASVGAPGLGGESGYKTLERLWVRPTCDVNGIISGYTGEGAKTVLPSSATAKVSFRLVPDQNPGTVERLFRAHVAKHMPRGVTHEIEELHGGRPWKGHVEGRLFEAAERALLKSFGKAPVLTGEGGSIPIVVEFEEILEAPALLIGFALPGANMHAPNEWFPVENFELGARALAYLYDELAS
jgi:acetylornithine deacetylase/succinyl-diaminopimelate desuccinylase-like protein